MPTDPLLVGRVIPDVLDPFTKSISLRVTYGNKVVNNGCELKPSQILNQPRADIGGDDLRNLYTLVCFTLLSAYLHAYIASATSFS